jgi:hypothetical protein
MLARPVLIALLVLGILTGGVAQADEAGAGKAAVSAAEAWLKLIDAGSYAESWQDFCAGYFKGAVKPEAWEESMRALRVPLGRVLSRRLKGWRYATTLPGAPDGEYVVIEFETTFEHKLSAVETVTPMMDKDGRWRVSGYYIR